MTRNEVITLINGSIHYLEMANANTYRGKVYVVTKHSRIDNCFKTKRGAEGHIKREKAFSYYDESIMDMVNAGSGCDMFEVLESELVNIKTDYAIWYRELRSLMSATYMHGTLTHYANKYLVSGELFDYVMASIEEIKNHGGVYTPAGYTLSETDNKQLVKIEEVATVEPVEEVKEVEITTEAAEQENNSDVEYTITESVHTKTGATIYLVSLNNKVSKDEFKNISDKIKSLGGYWSRFTKTYIFNTDPTSLLIPTAEGQQENTPVTPVKVEVIETIEIDDIESYTVDPKLSARENSVSMFRSKDRDHNKEIQGILLNWNNQLIAALEGNTNTSLENSSKRKLQSLKKRYYNNYIKMLNHKANNPSWVVTGRGGLNVNRYNKKASQYDRMIGKSVEIEKEFNKLISSTTWKVQQEINKQSREQFEELKKNINTKSIKFKRSNDDNINGFKLDFKTTIYNYDNYYILSNYWGKFRVYQDNKEIGKFNSLNDAKVFVISQLQQVA